MIAPAYYQAPVHQFLIQSADEVLGQVTAAHGFALELTQRDAWRAQIELLQNELGELDHGEIFFEFAIPRMGKRADVVLLLDGAVFVLEFKVGASSFDRGAIDQVHDYALDLKNFHKGSHDLPIVPILIATRAPSVAPAQVNWADDQVAALERMLAEKREQIQNLENAGAFDSFDVQDTIVEESRTPTVTGSQGPTEASAAALEAEPPAPVSNNPPPFMSGTIESIFAEVPTSRIGNTARIVSNVIM